MKYSLESLKELIGENDYLDLCKLATNDVLTAPLDGAAFAMLVRQKVNQMNFLRRKGLDTNEGMIL